MRRQTSGVRLAGSLPLAVGLLVAAVPAQQRADANWSNISADMSSTRSTTLDQINPSNFEQLEVAWEWTENLPAINARGYGLTFGLHTRIDSRVQEVTEAIHVGNIYVTRNQVGATVGSQPFGGEGMSGSGPKAGGPLYLPRFFAPAVPQPGTAWQGTDSAERLAKELASPPAAPAPFLTKK